MRKILFALLGAILSIGNLFAQDSLSVAADAAAQPPALDAGNAIAQARQSYDAADFSQAITLYEEVSAQKGASAPLYYNLGCAYFKNKEYARAILNFERSLLLDPGNDDARVNLQMAQAQTVDKIESITPPVFVTWSNALRDCFSAVTWSWFVIGFFLVFLVCASVYFFGRKPAVRRAGFYLGLLSLVLAAVAWFYAAAQNTRLQYRDHAIVMAPTVTVRSSPADSGTQLFTLHEGTKVRLRSTLGEWAEIELSDGNVGWLPQSSVEVI